mgnify:CR=1 FL=1
MRILWILRLVYLFLLVLYIVTWVKFAIEGHYREIVDDFPAIMFLSILWGCTEAYYWKRARTRHS